MATSSVERSAGPELGSSSLRVPVVSQDLEDGERSPRSPSVRAFVASLEQQQQQQQQQPQHHKPLCRTDGVGRQRHYHHERPLPPSKTTSAVLMVFVLDRIACTQCIDAGCCYRCRTCVCLCVFGTRVNCAKTAEPVQMLF